MLLSRTSCPLAPLLWKTGVCWNTFKCKYLLENLQFLIRLTLEYKCLPENTSSLSVGILQLLISLTLEYKCLLENIEFCLHITLEYKCQPEYLQQPGLQLQEHPANIDIFN